MPLWMFFLTFFALGLPALAPSGAPVDIGFPSGPSVLLANGGALARTLTRSCVRVSPLAAHGQALAVTQAAEAAEVHEALDVHRDVAAQIALDLDLLLLDDLAQAARLVVVELVGPLRERHLGGGEDLLRERPADAV